VKARLLEEPELQFGAGTHVDPRFGVLELGPADQEAAAAPREIPVGIVGTAEGIEAAVRWLRKCRKPIQPLATARQPNLHPPFPGFRADTSFRSQLRFDSRLQRTIAVRDVRGLSALSSRRARLDGAVDLLITEISALAETGLPRVILVCPPLDLLGLLKPDQPSDPEPGEPWKRTPELHDVLKARGLGLPIPLQLLRPATYDAALVRKQAAVLGRPNQQQDDATKAWNLHTALYYKAGGFPWSLVRDPHDLDSCFIGVSFYYDTTGQLATSMAQVFDERGEGVIVRGGPAKMTKGDRRPYLPTDEAQRLLVDALTRYRAEHRRLPARVVVHKTSRFRPEEVEGMQAGADAERISALELLSLAPSKSRVSTPRQSGPFRGTQVVLDDRQQLLYTSGVVPFYGTYPGPYVPQPIGIRLHQAEQSLDQHAREILALTKLNWNNSRLDGRDPITMRAAQGIGTILRHVPADGPVGARYAFYM
jgi:hypothetical protein